MEDLSKFIVTPEIYGGSLCVKSSLLFILSCCYRLIRDLDMEFFRECCVCNLLTSTKCNGCCVCY